MSEKRLRFTMESDKLYSCIFDNGNELTCFELVDLLNGQQATITKQEMIINERNLANERLNKFIIHIGLEKEYVKWAIRKKEYGDE